MPVCRINILSKLVIDKPLDNLPRRKTDNSIIIRSKDAGESKARVFKLNAKGSGAVMVERLALNINTCF